MREINPFSQVVPWRTKVNVQAITYIKMLTGCWHCYLQALASFLHLQCHECGSFGKCSGLRERESMLLDHSQFQTKDKKDLTICFLSLKCFCWIPFVLSVNMVVAFSFEVSEVKMHFQWLFTLEQAYHIVFHPMLKWLLSTRSKKVQDSQGTLHWQIESHMRRHRDCFWCGFIFRMVLLITFSC